MDKKGLLLYLDTIPQWQMMSDAQAGSLIKALLDYAESGKPLESDDIVVKMAFAFISAQVDRADESYQKVCERNKKAAENRWKKKAESLPEEEKADPAESETVPDESEVCKEIPENTTEHQTVPENTKKCLPNPNPNPKPNPNPNNISFCAASGEKKKEFVAPSVEDVEKFIRANGFQVDAKKFIATYNANGWVTSNGQKMADWQAMVQVWHINACTGLLPQYGRAYDPMSDPQNSSFDISELERLANSF